MTARFRTIEVSDPAYEHDGLRCATVFSEALGGRADCTLWSPPEDTGGPLPLIVLLHGVYASHWAWTLAGGAHIVAAAMVASGEVAPFALAMPSDGLYRHGSGYVTTNAGAVERWIVEEVPAIAELAIAGVIAAAPLAIVGLSMGGFGALSIGAWNHPRVTAAAGMSSITDFEQMSYFVGSLDDYDIDHRRRRVIDSIIANKDKLPRLHIDCGRDDPLIEHNRSLHAALVAEGVEHAWHEHRGGHDWGYWHEHLADALRFCVAPHAPPTM